MNIYEIKSKLERQEKAVFSINEISRLIGKPKNIAAVYANRMQKKGLLFRIEKNRLSVSDDIFIVASQLGFPSYLGLSTALYLNNVLPQIIDRIYIISPKQKRQMMIFDTDIIFIKFKPDMMFGYKKIRKGNSFVFVSDLEKTIIDILISRRYFNLGSVIQALKKADTEKLACYLTLLKKEHLNRRVGYLLDSLGIKHSIIRKTKTIYRLNPLRKEKGKFNNKWFLYINERI